MKAEAGIPSDIGPFLKYRINSIKQLTTVTNCFILFITKEG